MAASGLATGDQPAKKGRFGQTSPHGLAIWWTPRPLPRAGCAAPLAGALAELWLLLLLLLRRAAARGGACRH